MVAQGPRIHRLSIAALLVVAACQRAPARIYTDADIAKLEERVLAKVAETNKECSRPELYEFMSSLDAECQRACEAIELRTRVPDVNVDSIEVGKVDEQCAPKIIEALGRAAATSPSCSPFQVGVRGEPIEARRDGTAPPASFIALMHTEHIVVRHALREVDPYVGAMELAVALQVAQNMGRGRINLIQSTIAGSFEAQVLAALDKILVRSSLTKDQLHDIALVLDAALAIEPDFSEVLQGEAMTTALHMGVAGLKPADWQPPGGRGELTWSNGPLPGTTTHHDRRDDAAQFMAAGLRFAEIYAEACPPGMSLERCYSNIRPTGTETEAWSHWNDDTDRQASRVAMFPDDDTRRDSQQQLLGRATGYHFMAMYVQGRARAIVMLSAVRLHVQVLLDGGCPGEPALAAPPYLALRTPAVLGDSFPVKRKDGSMIVEAPAWAGKSRNPSTFPITIACPQ